MGKENFRVQRGPAQQRLFPLSLSAKRGLRGSCPENPGNADQRERTGGLRNHLVVPLGLCELPVIWKHLSVVGRALGDLAFCAFELLPEVAAEGLRVASAGLTLEMVGSGQRSVGNWFSKARSAALCLPHWHLKCYSLYSLSAGQLPPHSAVFETLPQKQAMQEGTVRVQ